MQEGALGIGTALIYRPAGSRGPTSSSHSAKSSVGTTAPTSPPSQRRRPVLECLEELLTIVVSAVPRRGLPSQSGRDGELAEDAAGDRRIEAARASGQRVAANMYPTPRAVRRSVHRPRASTSVHDARAVSDDPSTGAEILARCAAVTTSRTSSSPPAEVRILSSRPCGWHAGAWASVERAREDSTSTTRGFAEVIVVTRSQGWRTSSSREQRRGSAAQHVGRSFRCAGAPGRAAVTMAATHPRTSDVSLGCSAHYWRDEMPLPLSEAYAG